MSDKTPSAELSGAELSSDRARDELAFIRALVAPDDRWQQQFGRIYFAAGVCYSIQMVAHVGQLMGWISTAPAAALIIGWGPTVAFAAIMTWIIMRDRPRHIGGASRAVGTVFASVGLANIALCISIGSIALRLHSQTIWFIYPVVVMILQGMAWLVAFILRRRAWLGLVAMGWFAVGIAMAVFIDNMVGFLAAAAAGVFFCMTIPGFHLMRQARSSDLGPRGA